MQRSHSSDRAQLRAIARRAMLHWGLLPDYSAEVLEETDALVKAGAPSAAGAIRDLRGLLWASIDNDDSRDLDQLSVAVPSTGGAARILVAVADVDAACVKGSAIDGHAQTNTTSVYTSAHTFSMLPEPLSTDLTSLGADEERLAVVVDLSVDVGGAVAESDIYRAVVVNRAKLAYGAVAAWLDGVAPAPPAVLAVSGLAEQLRIQDRTAQRMRGLRQQHGALTLETVEARAAFDGDALVDLRADERNRAKDLIEDFMIAANGAATRYLERKGFPSLRRVLRSPERWGRIVELAAALAEGLPAEPSARALEQFLEKRQRADPERFADLSLSVVKLLGRGEYVLEHAGRRAGEHFGLAVKNYTHSTAPNRRFPDLVIQRLLKAALAGEAVPYRREELDEIAGHCTEQEDRATKVERQVRKSAAALLLQSRVGERFDAIVTGASEKGTWVRILQLPAEGKVVRGFESLDVGDRVRVQLVDTDVERGFIDFERVRGS